jgi:hypothetical protein
LALVIDNTHTAPGQMAGYLFQPDRALVLLCSCKSKESVSIELVDDVAAVDDNNNVIYREQDKSSIQAEGQPFKDRSKDLWNTLMIWINEIKAGTLKIETTRLVCVTNKKLDKNSLINKIPCYTTAKFTKVFVSKPTFLSVQSILYTVYIEIRVLSFCQL